MDKTGWITIRKLKKLLKENKRLKERIANTENEIRCWRYETQILIEFCRSVANEKGMSLLSYQQLNSPTANSSKKVRMLFQKIRKTQASLKETRVDTSNNTIRRVKYDLILDGNTTKANCDNIFSKHKKIFEELINVGRNK